MFSCILGKYTVLWEIPVFSWFYRYFTVLHGFTGFTNFRSQYCRVLHVPHILARVNPYISIKHPWKRRRRVGFSSFYSKRWCTISGPLLKSASPYKHTRVPGNVNTFCIFYRPIRFLGDQTLFSCIRLGYTGKTRKQGLLGPVFPVLTWFLDHGFSRFWHHFRELFFW